MAEYIRIMGLDTLYNLDKTLGVAGFSKLVCAFYPDILSSLHKGLTPAEFLRLSQMNAGTLNSLGNLASPQWTKSMLKVISGMPPMNFVTAPVPAGPGVVLNHAGNIDQTSTQTALINSCVTELNVTGNATRNLIFNALGNCIAEINFANHGYSAVSGHAHVYPVKCVLSTGHHAIGTPHVDMADYPPTWRQLPAGTNPATPLGT
jgi:hypothetical protein